MYLCSYLYCGQVFLGKKIAYLLLQKIGSFEPYNEKCLEISSTQLKSIYVPNKLRWNKGDQERAINPFSLIMKPRSSPK